MRRLPTILLALTLALTSVHAEAKRMGGGKSMGRQSSNVTQQQSTTPPGGAAQGTATQAQQQPGRQANQTAPAANAAPKRPWAGMLGGLAAGLGLAWLANALGFGEGLANVMLILLVVMAGVFLWRMFRRNTASAGPNQPDLAYQGAAEAPRSYNPKNVGNDASARPWEQQTSNFQASQPAASGSMIGSALSGSQNWGVPAGFDIDGFLTAAKRNFTTLQDAWDRADASSLRAMMTDEMLAEVRQQLAEREAAGKTSKTVVEKLDAQLLGIEETADDYLASVEFSGMVNEDDSGLSPFREVWNMSKSKSGQSGWLVAGIQSMQ